MIRSKHLIVFLFFLLLTLSAHAQCAMCKAAAESDLQNNPNSVAKGLNSGILFLMAFPYLIVAVIFRKDLQVFLHNIRHKEKTPFSKDRLHKLTFLFTFITCTVILFILFISFYKPY